MNKPVKPPPLNIAKRLLQLFPVNTQSYAYYTPEPGNEKYREDGKLIVRAQYANGGWNDKGYISVDAPVTEKAWLLHLTGKQCLTPRLVCDDGKTRVTVIDLDIYNCDPRGLVKAAADSGLPIYVKRSKSKAVHVVIFHHDHPLTVAESNYLAKGLASELGVLDLIAKRKAQKQQADIEYFPKPVKNGGTPFGLNMPFLGGSNTGFLHPDLSEIPVGEFLDNVLPFPDGDMVRLSAIGREVEEEEKPPVKAKRRSKKKTKFAEEKLEEYAAEMEKLEQGQRDDPQLRMCFHLGTMIGKGWITRERVTEKLSEAMQGWDKNAFVKMERHLDDGEMKADEPRSGMEVTEDSFALTFAGKNADTLRYDCEMKYWYEWNVHYWKKIIGHKVRNDVRNMLREMSIGADPLTQRAIRRLGACKNVEEFVQMDHMHGIQVTHDIWNKDPLLLGTPGGTVELKSGKLREGRPSEHISIVTTVTPAETANCPLWIGFLEATTKGNIGLLEYLQILCGYALLGDNREEQIVFLWGAGGNGKGVFVTTVGNILGEYRVEGAEDLFTEVDHAKHSTDIAMLVDARLVTMAEAKENRYWDMTRVKQLTGGDPVTARLMRRDNITFLPKFVPWVSGNNVPRMRNVDDAAKRRLTSMIPFLNKVAEALKDPLLKKKLEEEYPAILRWMIEGAVKYLKVGNLSKFKPDVVTTTTDRYFKAQDPRGRWLEASVVETGKKGDTVLARDIFQHSWQPWALNAGEDAGLQRDLTAWLMTKFENYEPKGRITFRGIKCADVDEWHNRKRSEAQDSKAPEHPFFEK